MNKVFSFFALIVILFGVVSSTLIINAATESNPDVITLFADQDTAVGSVEVWNDEDYLYVKYVTTGDWMITETHLSVEADLSLIPQKKGNPIPGKFEFSENHDYVSEYLYTIEIDWAALSEVDDLFVAAHAKVAKSIGNCIVRESAWADGDDFEGKNWATYFTYDYDRWEYIGQVNLGTKSSDTTTFFALEAGKEYKFEFIDIPTNSYIDIPTNSYIDIPTNSYIDIPTNKFIDIPTDKGYLEVGTIGVRDISTNSIIDVPTIRIIDVPTLHIIDVPTCAFRYSATEGFFVTFLFSDSAPVVDVFVWT